MTQCLSGLSVQVQYRCRESLLRPASQNPLRGQTSSAAAAGKKKKTTLMGGRVVHGFTV